MRLLLDGMGLSPLLIGTDPVNQDVSSANYLHM